MTSSLPRHGFLILTLLTLLLVLLWQASSLDDSLLISSSEGAVLVDQDKARLGSAPPNCRNRCNQCTPCTAVQDPASPSGLRLRDGCSLPIDQYSNYKPLGWKCRCDDRLYNP